MHDEDDRFKNGQGEMVSWDQLDEAEQAYYNHKDAFLLIELDEYCNNFWAENGSDWGSGPHGSLTEEDYEHSGHKD